jgi:hypothetical protein
MRHAKPTYLCWTVMTIVAQSCEKYGHGGIERHD